MWYSYKLYIIKALFSLNFALLTEVDLTVQSFRNANYVTFIISLYVVGNLIIVYMEFLKYFLFCTTISNNGCWWLFYKWLQTGLAICPLFLNSMSRVKKDLGPGVNNEHQLVTSNYFLSLFAYEWIIIRLYNNWFDDLQCETAYGYSWYVHSMSEVNV